MSVLVLTEHAQGAFKKKSFEAVQYAAHIANAMGTTVTAVALGSVSNDEMQALGAYGAQKVLHVADAQLDNLNSKAYTRVLLTAAAQESATVIVCLHDTTGKAVAPRVAARLKAGMVGGAVGYPDLSNGFTVKKNVFSGKAFAFVKVTSDVKVITLMPNTFAVIKGEGSATVNALAVSFEGGDFAVQVKEIAKASGSVPLSEAELVVSGGRGLKGPENWGLIENLANALGAATACSRPVADSHWRPHHEHVGQTGGTIRPNLYIACGISGAIQHLAGVNGSKTIVVINKDPEAPFFKAADYGVLGDVFEVLPRLTEAVNKFKASH
jgi:electron transfer flavoprotein alpha subunit